MSFDTLTNTECDTIGYFHNEHTFNLKDIEEVIDYILRLPYYNFRIEKIDGSDQLIFKCPISSTCEYYINIVTMLQKNNILEENNRTIFDKINKKIIDILKIKYNRITYCLDMCCKGSSGIILSEPLDEIKNGQYPIIQCEHCDQTWCAKCNIKPYHKSGDCNDGYCDSSFVNNTNEDIDTKTKKFILNNTIVCPNCSNSLIKNDGCDHLTCNCGAEICWVCGLDITGNANSHVNEDNEYNCSSIRDNCSDGYDYVEFQKVRSEMIKNSRKEMFKDYFSDYELEYYFKKIRDQYDDRKIFYRYDPDLDSDGISYDSDSSYSSD